jgi:hypothetical protein
MLTRRAVLMVFLSCEKANGWSEGAHRKDGSGHHHSKRYEI